MISLHPHPFVRRKRQLKYMFSLVDRVHGFFRRSSHMTSSQALTDFLNNVESENQGRIAGLGPNPNADIRTICLALLALTRFSKRELAQLGKLKQPSQVSNAAGKSYDVGILIGATERQTANDIEILMRSLHQRQGGALDPFVAALTQADGLVRKALSVLFDNGIADKVAAITYLGKIQRVPYARILMVGIPIWSAIDPLFMTAVAHEAGHYLHSELAQALGGNPGNSTSSWSEEFWGWQEEIFADIVSILLAGPAAALSMLMIARRSALSSLAEDDGVHPPPLLRLWTAHTVLMKVLADESPSAEELAQVIQTSIGSFSDAIRQKGTRPPTTQTEARAMPIDKVDFYKDEMVRYTNGWLEDETLANLVIGNKLTRWTYGPQAAASGDEEALVSALRDEMQQTLNAPTSMTERIGLDSVKDVITGEIVKLALTNPREGVAVESPVFPEDALPEEGAAPYVPAILGPDWDADEGGTLISGRP
jgi:hypothetical protein